MWRQDLGGFRHEVHAAKDDDICIGFRRLAGQRQGIAGVVGNVLNLRDLVIMRQNHRIALLR